MARSTITFKNIPEWAIYALEYGCDECGDLSEEDIAQVNAFVQDNFLNGYYMSVKWEEYDCFNPRPAFGLPCGTYEVDFMVEE